MSSRPPSRPTPPPTPPRISPLPFAGMIGLTCLLFLYLGSAAVLRWWAVVLLVVVWLALLLVAFAWWTPHPRRLPWLVAVGVGIWLVLIVGSNLAAR